MANSKAFSASAPGKIIFSGEHAVVYDAMGLALSINRRTTVEIQLDDGWPEDSFVEIEYRSLPTASKRLWKTSELMHLDGLAQAQPLEPKAGPEILESIKRLCGETGRDFIPAIFFLLSLTNLEKFKSVKIVVTSDLPTGAGLGSSAAFCVSFVAAVLLWMGLVSNPLSDADRKLIDDWAFVGECILHGNPSGIDNTTSTYGGAVCLHHRKASLLPKSRKMRLLVTNTKVPRSTAKLVQGVRERRDRIPEVMDPVISSLGAISSRAIGILAPSDPPSSELSLSEYGELEELVRVSQQLLNSLGVGHAALDNVVSLTARHGLASKLSGAGGGGCAVTLIPPHTPQGTHIRVWLHSI